MFLIINTLTHLHPPTPTHPPTHTHKHRQNIYGTSFTAQVWVYSSQALTKSSGLPDLLVGHVSHGAHAGAFEHQTVFGLLVCFINPLGSVNDTHT
jgi:hypothetical protein